jgi:hypothetical protein
MQLYGTSISSQLSPLFQVDPNITFDYRFKSNHFVNSGGWYTQYLTSWLIGDTYADVIDLIDRLADPDYTGEKSWVIDDDPDPWYHNFASVHSKLTQLEFFLNPETYVNSQDWITTDINEVMGYVSHGVHAGMPANYILEELEFDYTNGANFLSWESFNAYSFGVLTSSQVGHGLISDFIHREGSGGSGHVYEPWTDGATYEDRTYPAYAMGYTLVDAQYHGIYYDAWRNMVIGDPLTAIAWGKQTLTRNLTWSGHNLVTGEITIPVDSVLTIEGGSYIELRHQGFIPCISTQGRLVIGEGTEFEIYSWVKGLFLSSEENPRLFWGEHPTMQNVQGYNIYRKFDDGEWNFLIYWTELEYLDESVTLSSPEGDAIGIVYYKVTAVSQSTESDYSNTVSAEYFEASEDKKFIAASDQKVFEYSLSQNYPNPFNPVTRIKYQLPTESEVKVSIYNSLGEITEKIIAEMKGGGYHEIVWNAEDYASGVYLLVFEATSANNLKTFRSVKKLILIK